MALHYVDAKVSTFYYKNPLWFLRHRNIKCRLLEAILSLKSMSLVRLDPLGFGFLWFVPGTVELTLEMVIYLFVVTYGHLSRGSTACSAGSYGKLQRMWITCSDKVLAFIIPFNLHLHAGQM